ncbi:unnamed protein product [Pieris brassicae]|uniref:Uncharacterized protein n=1 Tax=Pieris brassicae TaxID=7116 RepID=A0A9P0TQ16_PIEBR|nr:unnamed protein product [Pieris brassicae]
MSLSLCFGHYHYQCLGTTTENFHKESKQAKANWKCPNCKSIEKKGDSTPVRQENPSTVVCSPSTLSGVSDSYMDELKLYIEAKLQETTATILAEVKQQIILENKSIHEDFEQLKVQHRDSRFPYSAKVGPTIQQAPFHRC